MTSRDPTPTHPTVSPRGPTEIGRATTPADFKAAARLLVAMRDWDAAQLRNLGLDPSDVVATYYGRLDPLALAEDHRRPSSALFLAHVEGAPAGVIACSRLDLGTAELEKLWVDPPFRGAGLAREMLETVLTALRSEGFGRVVLETATFMASAIRLYESAGFVRRRSLGPVLPSVRDVAVTMERRLD